MENGRFGCLRSSVYVCVCVYTRKHILSRKIKLNLRLKNESTAISTDNLDTLI